MKTKVFYLVSKITVAVVFVAILVFKATAAETPNLKMVPFASERALISLSNTSNTNSELTIEDASGDVLYYKESNISDEVYSKKFDFKNLPDGDYKITAKNNSNEKILYFTVRDNKISVKNDAALNEPFVEIRDNVLKVSLLNNTLNNINFIVSNEDGEVYRKSLGSNFNINAGFSLAKLESGNYAINITDGDKTYSYSYKK